MRAVNVIEGDDRAGAAATVNATPVVAAELEALLVDVGRDRQAVLTWGLLDDGGLAVINFEYRFQRLEGNEGRTMASCREADVGEHTPWRSTGQTLGAEVSGLANGSTYKFEVRAQTRAGPGHVAFACADIGTAPHAPVVTVSIGRTEDDNGDSSSGDVELTFGWQAAVDGGFPVFRYEYMLLEDEDFVAQYPDFPDELPDDTLWTTACATNDGTEVRRGEGTPPCTFRVSEGDLDPVTPYRFLLRGENRVGKGLVTIATVTTPPEAPERPELLAAAPLDGAALLTWEPGRDNGAEILFWQYRRCEEDAECGDHADGRWRTVPSDALEVDDTVHIFVVPGLTNNRTYEIGLRARNAVDFGPESTVKVTPVPGLHIRAAVRNLKVADMPPPSVDANGKWTVTLTWSASQNDELARYEWSLDGGEWKAVAPLTATTLAVSGLEPGTTYAIRVRVVLDEGGTGPEREVSVTPGEPPPAVPSLRATPGDALVTLQWSKAADTNGQVVGYEYRHRPKVDQGEGLAWSIWFSAGTALQAEVTGLSNGVAYEFQVRALNHAGGEEDEDEISKVAATPVADPVPGAPGELRIEVGDAMVRLSWREAVGTVNQYLCRYRAKDGVGLAPCIAGGPLVCDESAANEVRIPPDDPRVTITGLTNEVTYEFEVTSCIGDRESEPSRGEATPTVAVLAPGAPEQLVGQRGNGAVMLRWEVAASNDGRPVTGYEYRWRRTGGEFGDWTDACAYPPDSDLRARCSDVLEWRVGSLTNGTRFQFEVRARKGDLAGPAATVWITPGGVPDAPLDVRHEADVGELTVTWRPPADGGTAIERYDYRVRAGDGVFGEWAPVNDRLIEAGERFALLLTGLRDDTAYRVEIRAVNAVGPSLAAAVTSSPGTVQEGVLAAVPGDGEVQLRWRATSQSEVVRYQFRCTPAAASCGEWTDAGDLLRRDGNELFVTVTGLDNGTTYTFEVRAVDAAGVAGEPDAAEATPSGPPGVPTEFSAEAGDGEVTLAWDAPSGSGGAVVVRYEYRWGIAGVGFSVWQTASQSRTVTVGGLANGEEHVFEVRAVNQAGAGPPTTTVATPGGVPSAPLDLVAERAAQAVTLRWRPPASDGGVALSGYDFRYRRTTEPAFGAWTDVGAVTETTVTGLVNGIEYVFEVRARNAVFAGNAASRPATPGGVPSAPEALSTDVGDGRVTLRWEAPRADGGAEVTSYEIRSSAAEQSPGAWTDVGLERQAVVDGLTNGVAYVFEVRAVNAVGFGTVASTAATPWVASVPDAPSVTARADSRRVALLWNVPANGGDPIVRFEYRLRGGGEAFGEWVDAALATTAAVEELTNGVAYEFEVRAVNGIGAGEVGNAAATPAGLPGKPVLDARAGAEEVALAWQPPEDDGGLDIERYEYRWREQAATFVGWRDAGLERAATARGLRNGITYVFEVRAVNAKGPGEAATASATPASGVSDEVLANAWLSRFGRVSAGHVIDALQGRFADVPDAGTPRRREGRSPRTRSPRDERQSERRAPSSERVRHRGTGGRGPVSSGWRDGGGSLDGLPSQESGWPMHAASGAMDADAGPGGRSGGDLRDLARVLARQYLPGESFLLSAAPRGGATRVSAWGRVATGGFEGTDELASVEGRVRTLTVGGDVERGSLLAGLAVSHTSGDGGFRFLGEGASPARDGDDAESTLTGIYPYARFGSGRLSMWGVAGNAQGTLALTGDGVDVEADVTAGMGAIGMRGLWLSGGAIEVAVKSDLLRTWLAATGPRLDDVDTAVNRIRLLLEASASSALAGGRLTSSLELGVRHDSGGADRGGGMEFGGRLKFAGERRLTLSAAGRAVVGHGAEGFGEWGLSGSVLYAPRSSGTGASLRLVPAWGTTSSGVERLWAEPERWLPRRATPTFGVEAEYAYGFRTGRVGAVTGPYLAAGYRRGIWLPRTGWRLDDTTRGLRADMGVFHRESSPRKRGGFGVLLRLTVGR